MYVARAMFVVTPGYEALPTRSFCMYDDVMCLGCERPVEPVEWCEDVSSIGDDCTEWVIFVDDEVCQCTAEDDNE